MHLRLDSARLRLRVAGEVDSHAIGFQDARATEAAAMQHGPAEASRQSAMQARARRGLPGGTAPGC